MTKDKMIETLSRMWIECDPNRYVDPDEVMGPSYSSSSDSDKVVEHITELTGQPRWKWFIPRAEATLSFLDQHGLKIVEKE